MTVTPINCPAAMVRALLEGRKSQMRLPIKPQPPDQPKLSPNGYWWAGSPVSGTDLAHKFEEVCPYGQPGDYLWCREAFVLAPNPAYRADMPAFQPIRGWQAPSRMPRKHSRLTLRVTGVRVERLSDITETDAIAEGVIRGDKPFLKGIIPWLADADAFPRPKFYDAYIDLWESANGELRPGENPFVWVLTFDVLEQNVVSILKAAA